MYCCVMPSVSLNKQDSIKLEELNQNDSGISPSYFSGDSRGSDHMSPVSSSEDCTSSTPLNLSDQKMSPLLDHRDHSNRGSHQLVRGVTALTQPQLSLFNKNINFSDVQTTQPKSPSNTSRPISIRIDENGPLRSPLISYNDSSRSLSPASSVDSGDYQNHPLQQLAMVVKRNETTDQPPSEATDSNPEKALIYCPLCNFSTNSRSNFNAHLLSHEGQKCCYICELMTESVEELREHYLNVHDVNVSVDFLHNSGSGGEEEPGIMIPKVNSQGKIKKHRCKQCGIVCVTKLEFWEHCRGHIKQERLLTCPKCPFVTEYKHHLEYHLRNHFGSKPFKCNKCSYSCVNKSMLNSHLKSHSNVYQFRCNDCSYATKYCHSLKLHLRKYKHSPAMVLNPDGSPNPLPIVDVYGTRRGPKQRAKKTVENIPPKSIAKIPPSTISTQFYSSPVQFPNSNPTPFSMNSTQFLPAQTQLNTTQAPSTSAQTVISSGQTQFSSSPMRFSPNPNQFSSHSTQFSSNSTQFSPKPTQFSSNHSQFSPSQARFSPNQTKFSPKPTQFSPNQTQFSPNPTSRPHSNSPLPSPQAQLPTNQIQFPSSQALYSMFPSNYGLFPPTQLPFPYPLVPNTIPFPSLSLLQMDIPALLEEAKRSAETLEKLKQLLQSNNNNSQYISKAVAQQIIDEACKPSTIGPSPPVSPPLSPVVAENLSTTPLDLSKTNQEENSDIHRNNEMSPASAICKNRRKSKAVRRVAISSAFGQDNENEKRSPIHFATANLLSGAQKIY